MAGIPRSSMLKQLFNLRGGPDPCDDNGWACATAGQKVME
jgi:hypothetical protein